MHDSDLRWPRAAASGKKSGAQAGRTQGRGSVMQVEETAIPAVKIIIPKKHGDARGFFSEVYNRADWDKAGLRTHFRTGQSFVLGHGWHVAWATLPDAAVCAGQAGALHARPDSGRRGRHSSLVADLRPPCRGRTLGGQLAPGAGPDRVCARLHHLGARRRGSLQDDRALFGRQRPRRRLGRSGDRHCLAVALPGGPVLSDKDRRLPRLKDAPDLFE